MGESQNASRSATEYDRTVDGRAFFALVSANETRYQTAIPGHCRGVTLSLTAAVAQDEPWVGKRFRVATG